MKKAQINLSSQVSDATAVAKYQEVAVDLQWLSGCFLSGSTGNCTRLDLQSSGVGASEHGKRPFTDDIGNKVVGGDFLCP